MRKGGISYSEWKRRKVIKRRALTGSVGLVGVLAGAMLVLTLTYENVPYAGVVEDVQIAEEQMKEPNETKPEDILEDKPEEKQEDKSEEKQEDKPEEKQEDKSEQQIQENIEYVGVSDAGKPYAYDAEIVADKLRRYDYYNEEEKVVFLTFDDGTSSTVTPKILDILNEYDVKATFFVIGSTIVEGGERANQLLRREFEEGHAIANHTYGHDYSKLYPGKVLNLNNFVADLNKTDKLIEEILGVNFRTRVFRCPGGYMSWRNMSPLVEYQKEKNRVSVDWNALTKDSEGKKKTASELYNCMIETSKDKDMVVLLMHDTYGKEETAKVLPRIIEYYRDNGYQFKTLV